MRDLQRMYKKLNISAQMVAAASFVVVFTAMSTIVMGYLALDPNTNLDLEVDDIAPFDIRAPYDSSFESVVLTDQKRQEVVSSVRNVYKTDDEVTRRQVNRAHLMADYIDHVRHDAFASWSQKQNDMSAIADLELNSAQIETILTFSEFDWKRVRDQTSNVLSRLMSGEVREENLQHIYDTIPRQSAVFPEEQAEIVTTLVKQLLRPNTFIDSEATEAARESARAGVVPVVRLFRHNQIVVERGTVITSRDVEALNYFGLLTPANNNLPELMSALVTVLLGEMVVVLYLHRFRPRLLLDLPAMTRLGVLFWLALVLARMVISFNDGKLSYFYPGAALAILVASLMGPQLAILVVVVLGISVGIIAASVEMAALTIISGIVSALYLRRTERINAYFKAGTLAGAANAGVILAFGLTAFNFDAFVLFAHVVAGLVNGVLAAAVALVGLFVMGSVFNITTGLLLAELARSDNPLLQRLMREAPGTYQHSLMVANLGEAAAETIGANTLLVRVGALYHDIGKMYYPLLFVENQAYDAANVHAQLSPLESAQAIIRHVVEGEKMARKARLPAPVRAFILEHHGTTMPGVFWHNALKAAGGDESMLNRASFTYPGPKPQSREAAIVMIVDSCESAMRAVRPSGEEEIAALVNKIINHKMRAEQFDECDLTLRDLDRVRDAIVRSLKGVFHTRIKYPEDGKVRAARPAKASAPRATRKPVPVRSRAAEEGKAKRLLGDQPAPAAPAEPKVSEAGSN